MAGLIIKKLDTLKSPLGRVVKSGLLPYAFKRSLVTLHQCPRSGTIRTFKVLSSVLAPRHRGLYKRLFHSSNKCLIEDPYKTLGVDKSASASEIKKSYYKLAKKYHPDINKDESAEKKFHDIQGAYEILSDPEKKQQYDQFGSAAFDTNGGGPSGGNPFAGGNPFGQGSPFGNGQGNPFEGFNINFDDLFGSAFRSGAGQNSFSVFTGSNIELLKTISLKEAIFGIKNLKVDFTALDGCSTCNHTGLKPGAKKSTCATCGGTGSQVHYSHGGYQMASTCRSCEGSGVTISPKDACSSCRGEGVKEGHKNTELNLPPGLIDGQSLKLSGYGDSPRVTSGPGIKLRKGDLNIRIRVKPDPKYTVKGSQIIYNAEIPYTTAALGGVVEIPTVDGANLRLRVPSGTENGKTASISGKGFPIRNNINNRGDLVVTYRVKVPRPTSAAQTALLEALAEQLGDKTAKRSQSWSDIARDDIDAKAKDSKSTSKDESANKPDHPLNLKKIESFLSEAFKKITNTKDK